MKINDITYLACVGLGIALVAGCATQRDNVDLTQLLRELEAEERSAPGASPRYGGTAATRPDTPASAVHEAGASGGAPRELTIQPECLVQISVEEDPTLDGSYKVNEIGAVELSYVGPVILYNKTEADAADKIAEVLRSRHFRNATVRVKILRASYDRVKIDGQVVSPGIIRIGAGDVISLNDALLRAGGLRPAAKEARVRIVRDGLLSAVAMDGEVFSLVDASGRPSVPQVTLDNNDIVEVFARRDQGYLAPGEKEVLVLGEVNKVGVYRFRHNEPCTMMYLLFQMGGLPEYADQKSVKVLRRDEFGREREYVVDVKQLLEDGAPEHDFVLQNGDRVVVKARGFTWL